MNPTRRSLKILIVFSLVFILCGVLHIALYGVDFTTSAVQLYSAVAVLVWAYSLRSRITNTSVKYYLYAIVFLMELLSLSQACRYAVFSENSTLERYSWYGFYISYILIPPFFNQVAFRLNKQKDNRISKWWKLIDIPSIILLFLVLTNDFHEIVFRFPDGLTAWKEGYEYGISFYLIWILIMVQNIVSLAIIYIKCGVNASRRMIWLPAFFEAFFIAGQIMFFTDSLIRINGALIWNQNEFYIFSVAGLAESCIAMGLIPANMDYKKYFYLINDMAVIYDREGNPVYSNDEAEASLSKKDVLVKNYELRSGRVSFAVDMGPICALNRDLQEENDRIRARNRLLKSANALESEKSRLIAQNELYDSISVIVRPEIDRIREILDGSTDATFNDDLARIAVYNAYVKRRSNLELLKNGSPEVDIKELTTAIHESLEYLKLTGTDAILTASAGGRFPADMQILFYEFFEKIIESCMCRIKYMVVSLSINSAGCRLGMLADTDESLKTPDIDTAILEKYEGRISITEDDGTKEMSLVLKGGVR